MRVVTNLSLSSFGGIERILADIIGNSSDKLKPIFVTRSEGKKTQIFSYDSTRESASLPVIDKGEIPTFAISKHFKEDWVSNYIKGDSTNFNFIEPYVEQLEMYLRRANPDVALVNSTNDLAYLLSEACKRVGVPYVAAVHGLHSIEVDIDKRLSELSVIGGSDSVSYVSEHARKVAESTMGIIHPNSRVIYNSLDPRFISLGDESNLDGVCWIGRNHRIKNLDLLLDIARSNPQVQFRAIINPPIVGNKPINVSIHPPIQNLQELSSFYRRHNFLVSTSLFETFGNVPLEAISCGTPALVPRTMGISDLFRLMGLSDLVIESLEKEEYSRAMNELRGYRVPIKIRRELGEKFSAHKVAQNYIDLLESTANSTSTPAHKRINYL